MTINPNKTYRTRDGRAVRIYATDGPPLWPIHGAVDFSDEPPGRFSGRGWNPACWDYGGSCVSHGTAMDLVEVTLADELTKQIPWEALRPEIQWVAMNGSGKWFGYSEEPIDANQLCWTIYFDGHEYFLDALFMPDVESHRWRETRCKRPDSNETIRRAIAHHSEPGRSKSVTLRLGEARDLVGFFGSDEEAEVTIQYFTEAHSGPGLYVYCADYPEEGCMKLAATPAPDTNEREVDDESEESR